MNDGFDILQQLMDWVDSHSNEIQARGVQLQVSQPTTDKHPKNAVWIDLDSSVRIGRLTVWNSGEAELEILELSSGNVVLREHREITSRVGIDDAFYTLIAAVTNSA